MRTERWGSECKLVIKQLPSIHKGPKLILSTEEKKNTRGLVK